MEVAKSKCEIRKRPFNKTCRRSLTLLTENQHTQQQQNDYTIQKVLKVHLVRLVSKLLKQEDKTKLATEL